MKTHEPLVLKESDFYPYTPSPAARNLFFYPVCLGHYFYEAGYHLTRSSYDSFLLLYVLSGTMYIKDENSIVTVKKNQVALLDCYARHSYGTKAGCEVLWLHYDGVLARPWYEELKKSNHILFADTNSHAIFLNLMSLYQSFQKKERPTEAKISNLISSALTELFLKSNTASCSASDFIKEQTLPYITEHLTEDLSLARLASHAALSPCYFLRLFKKQTGLTPYDYILMARIDMAKYLLKTSSLQVKEIAFSCGFLSESVFCNAFRKKTGMSPLSYRGSLDLAKPITSHQKAELKNTVLPYPEES